MSATRQPSFARFSTSLLQRLLFDKAGRLRQTKILRSMINAPVVDVQTPDTVFVCAANGQNTARCPTGTLDRAAVSRDISPPVRSQMSRQPGDLRPVAHVLPPDATRGGGVEPLPDIPAVTEYCGYGKVSVKARLTSHVAPAARNVNVASPASLPASCNSIAVFNSTPMKIRRSCATQ